MAKSSSYKKLPSKDFIALFSSRRRACPVLKHNLVSEVFKGSKVHDFEYYGQTNYVLKGNLIYVIRNVSFTFDLKKLLENALRFVTDVVLNILPCSADFTLVDRSTILEV